MLTLADIKRGQKFVEACGGFHGPLACRYHDGRMIIDEEGTKSDDVGFQPNCDSCTFQTNLTLEHINMVQIHDTMSMDIFGKADRYGRDEDAAPDAERSNPPNVFASLAQDSHE